MSNLGGRRFAAPAAGAYVYIKLPPFIARVQGNPGAPRRRYISRDLVLQSGAHPPGALLIILMALDQTRRRSSAANCFWAAARGDGRVHSACLVIGGRDVIRVLIPNAETCQPRLP
jgi:hypothetical protein